VTADLDALFRCEKWACTLAEKHCLRRQVEVKWIPRANEDRPVYEHCASGECAQGVAIAEKHPGVAFARLETKRAPRLDIVRAVEERLAQGETMPKGYARGAACNTCGSTGTKHKAGCAEDGGKGKTVRVQALPAEQLRKVFERGAEQAPSVRVGRMTLDELLLWRTCVGEELARREKQLEEQLASVRKAIAEAA
jgi:hypothetical protein